LNLEYYHYNDGMGDSKNDDGDTDNPLSVKHLYHSSTWRKSHIEYNLIPKEFSDTSPPKRVFSRFFTFLKLF
jgi:hypothetical protein